jgi:hypothetical protein
VNVDSGNIVAKRGPKKRMDTSLTLTQVGAIRNTAARRAGQILRRFRENALEEGEFTPKVIVDKEGEPVLDRNGNVQYERRELSMSQIRSGSEVLKHVLPAMQVTQVEDITENRLTREEIDSKVNELLMQLQPQMVRNILNHMPEQERMAAIAGLDAEKVIEGEMEDEQENGPNEDS